MLDRILNITSLKKAAYLNPNIGNTFRNYFDLRRSTFLLILIHSVGVLGIISPFQDFILPLTPFSIFISFLLLINQYPELNSRMKRFVLLVISMGFLIEFIGVNTGFPFGQYYYGKTLGLSLWNIPIIIGVNWAMLVLGFGEILSKVKINMVGKSLLGACLMIGIDLLIEPVAVQYDFWIWSGGNIPVENYLGWFFVSAVFFMIYFRSEFKTGNPLGVRLIIVQFLFFSLLNIYLLF